MQAAAFSGSSDPDGTFTWTLDDIDNSTPGAGDYVFYLEFDIEVTGLINPAGDPDDQDNWAWWWNTGGNPTVVNTVNDRGRVTWSDGSCNLDGNHLAARHEHPAAEPRPGEGEQHRPARLPAAAT